MTRFLVLPSFASGYNENMSEKKFNFDFLSKTVGDFLRTKEEVVLGYIFGSHAKGRTGPLSDLDIAVLVSEKVPENQYLQFRVNVISGLMSVLHINEIDVVLLNQVSSLLGFQIIKNGKLVFCRDEKRRVEMVFRILQRYHDFAYTRRIQQQALYQAIEDGSYGRRIRSDRFTVEKIRELSRKIAKFAKTWPR